MNFEVATFELLAFLRRRSFSITPEKDQPTDMTMLREKRARQDLHGAVATYCAAQEEHRSCPFFVV